MEDNNEDYLFESKVERDLNMRDEKIKRRARVKISKGRFGPRITAGLYKNRKLLVPKEARPVTERVKISIFDTLADVVTGAYCLDIFAGSGNMGIEALSRGASHVVFIDKSSYAIKYIQENLHALNVPEEQYSVFEGDYLKFNNRYKATYNLIFVDPPFDSYQGMRVTRIFNLLNDLGVLVLKVPNRVRNKDVTELKDFIVIDKVVGRNRVIIMQKK